MIFVEKCKDPHSVAILIRAGLERMVDEAERAMIDSLSVVSDVIENNKIVAGGGAVEMPVQVSDRADRLIARLRALDGNVALFSHGHFGCVLAVRWIGLPVMEKDSISCSGRRQSAFSATSHPQPRGAAHRAVEHSFRSHRVIITRSCHGLVKVARRVSLHRGQHFIERHGGEAGGGVGHGVGDDEFAPVQQRAASVHHVRDITFAFRFVRRQQRFAQASDDAGRVPQSSRNAPMQYFRIAPTPWLNTSQPRRFQSASRSAQLDEFPRLRRREHSWARPEIDVVGNMIKMFSSSWRESMAGGR